jgi:hypothetical protein
MHHRPLWLSETDGARLSYAQVETVIKMTTLATVIAMSPHLFRTSAASTAATRGGANPYLASPLLHYTHPAVTKRLLQPRNHSVMAGDAIGV